MRRITNDLIVLLALLVFGLMLILPAMAKGAEPNEVAALRAELAKVTAELRKIKYANVLPIDQQIKSTPDDWKAAYGDSETTQFYFNIRTALIDFEKCKSDIMLLVSVINGITDPNDPNSLAARVEVAEVKVWELQNDQQTIKVILRYPHNTEPLLRMMGMYATKEDDPNEVAR